MSNIVLTFILFLAFQFAAVAAPETVAGDSVAAYHLRAPGEEFLQEFRDNPAFNYTVEQRQPGWWERLKWWILKHLSGNHDVGNVEWLDWGVKVMAALLIAFLIYKLIRWRHFFAPRDKEVPLPGGTDLLADGTLNSQSYSRLLEEATGKGDYPLAVRIHYWYILWLMDHREWIRLDPHKTNMSYFYELKKEGLRPGFGHLTHVFNCVCYGEFRVDAALYDGLRQEFEAFEKEITHEDKA